MDQYELNKNENSTEKAKALELALKYSFVTPLTSLVVVKPNDTTTSAAPEKIKPLNDRYNFGSLMASSPLYQLGSSSSMMSANSFASHPAPPGMSAISLKSPDNYVLTSDVDSPEIIKDESNSTSLHDIKELTWLNDSITLNATNTVYQVSLNTSGQSYQNCTTPDQIHGNCKHLKDCVVASILNSFDTYLSLFCPIGTLYAGICCLV
uniref:ACYPI002825 protein n=1 Tax=Acyrthosiphon pisum TaxID=7029 RepID=C4WY73_ACYPI|nr:ACYPI002825 [Acyrthosiphon pisum]